MFRVVMIASTSSFVCFSHYFEAIPIQSKANSEKEIVETCLSTGEKEGKLHVQDLVVTYRRVAVFIIIVGATHATNSSTATELLHSFANILTHRLHVMTEKGVMQRKDLIQKILEQMVHGSVLETRVTHIPALFDYKALEGSQ